MTEDANKHRNLRSHFSFGETSSHEARAHFRDTILKNARCPICGEQSFELLQLSGSRDDDTDDALEFGLPVTAPGRPDLLSVGSVVCGLCTNCGYLAQFMDLVVKGRFESAKGEGK